MDRLKQEYEARRQRLPSDEYSLLKKGNLYAYQQRQKATIQMFSRLNWKSLAEKAILEVGCGGGGILHEYLGYGVQPDRLHGIEYLAHRVAECHQRFPDVPVIHGDAQSLPYPDNHFDLVLQYTVLSSILAPQVRANVAREMRRVVRPSGVILWYDFWLNPKNPQTHGIRLDEIKSLFPDSRLLVKKITLAPPLARRLANVSWLACELLESLTILNSHYLVAIMPTK